MKIDSATPSCIGEVKVFEAKTQYEDRLITEPEQPDVMSETQYGVVDHLTWLICEKSRIESKGGRAEMMINGGGRMALIRTVASAAVFCCLALGAFANATDDKPVRFYNIGLARYGDDRQILQFEARNQTGYTLVLRMALAPKHDRKWKVTKDYVLQPYSIVKEPRAVVEAKDFVPVCIIVSRDGVEPTREYSYPIK